MTSLCNTLIYIALLVYASYAQTDFLCNYGSWADNNIVTWGTDPDCTLRQFDTCSAVGLTWYPNGMSWKDYIIQATINVPSICNGVGAGGAGILFRFQNDQQHYMVNLSPAFEWYEMSIWKVDQPNGCYPPDCRFTSTLTPNLAFSTNYNLRIEVDGSAFSVYLNNQFIWTVNDNTFTSGTVGLRVYQSSAIFTDLYITTPSPTRAPTRKPTHKPTRPPTRDPTRRPTSKPTSKPTRPPTRPPTKYPTTNPTKYPTNMPSTPPTNNPSENPSSNPTLSPSNIPTLEPTTTTKNPAATLVISPTARPSFTNDGEAMESTIVFAARVETKEQGPLGFLGLDVFLQYILIIGLLVIVILLIVGVTVCCVVKMKQTKRVMKNKDGMQSNQSNVAVQEGATGTGTTIELIHNSKQNKAIGIQRVKSYGSDGDNDDDSSDDGLEKMYANKSLSTVSGVQSVENNVTIGDSSESMEDDEELFDNGETTIGTTNVISIK